MAEDDGVGVGEAGPHPRHPPAAGPASWSIAMRTPSASRLALGRQLRDSVGLVDVAVDRVHRRTERLDLSEHPGGAHVAGMQDRVGRAEQLDAAVGQPRGSLAAGACRR